MRCSQDCQQGMLTPLKTRAELLAAERLKDLCKQLELAVLDQLQTYRAPPDTLEYLPPPTIAFSFMTGSSKPSDPGATTTAICRSRHC